MFVTHAENPGKPTVSIVRCAQSTELVKSVAQISNLFGPVSKEIAFRCDPSGDEFLCSFAQPLADGDYLVTYEDGSEDKFFVLFGDLDGDRTVGLDDKAAFNRTVGSIRGAQNYRAECDSDGDGKIGNPERLRFAANYRKTLSEN